MEFTIDRDVFSPDTGQGVRAPGKAAQDFDMITGCQAVAGFKGVQAPQVTD